SPPVPCTTRFRSRSPGQGRALMVFVLPPGAKSWHRSPLFWEGLDAATAELDPPFGVISAQALAYNADSMVARAAGTTIRVASKSLRVRSVIDTVLTRPGFAGVLAYTLPEALWLASPD